MNKDEIIRMAREAGFNVEKGYLLRITGIDEDLERFAALVAKHTLLNLDPSSFMSWQEGYEAGKQTEREACVQIVESEAMQYAEPVWAFEIVNDIKARGQE